ncbi:dual specificity protein phosphatase [Frankia casuarinae]|uniref:Dual specificity protein phosphatase n=2 Tax=Frankiaceae TaxID=74712 RepID=Q2J9I6_FRACC|nr:dual specificity protein phosphatase [Frankia casuarinae]
MAVVSLDPTGRNALHQPVCRGRAAARHFPVRCRDGRGVSIRTMTTWEPGAPGVLALPSGRLIRGRGLRQPLPDGSEPSFGLYLVGRQPPAVPWESRWIRWPDFRLPSDREAAARSIHEAWTRADSERVEIACSGGKGRTGTALACIAVLDGIAPGEAVDYIRTNYARHAVETPWQHRYVRRFQ